MVKTLKLFLALALSGLFLITPSLAIAAPTPLREIISSSTLASKAYLSSNEVSISYKGEKNTTKGRASVYYDFAKGSQGEYRLLSYGTGLLAREETALGGFLYTPGNINSLPDHYKLAVGDLSLPLNFTSLKESLSPFQIESRRNSVMESLLANNLNLVNSLSNLDSSRSTIMANKLGKTYKLAIDLDRNCNSCRYHNGKNRALIYRSYKINNKGIIVEITQEANVFAQEEYRGKDIVVKYTITFLYGAKFPYQAPQEKVLDVELLNQSKAFASIYYEKAVPNFLNAVIQRNSVILKNNNLTEFYKAVVESFSQFSGGVLVEKPAGLNLGVDFESIKVDGGVLHFCLLRNGSSDFVQIINNTCS